MDVGGVRTWLAVALRKEGTLLGAIAVQRQEVRPFTDKQIALIQNFAAQAVIAMENARLLTETREALEQQTATAEVLGVINASPGDLAPVFDAILDKATQVCAAAFGIMNTYDGERFHTAAMHRLPPALAETYRHERPPPGPHSPLTLIAQGKNVVSIDDLTIGPGADLPRRRILIEQGGARTWLAVALRKDGALLGTISAYRTEVRPFTDKQIALLQNFAAQAVIAMENARLITETREALEQQTATAEVLEVINASPGDLAPVFDAMLEKALQLCDGAFGSLLTYDGELFRTVAFCEMPQALVEILSPPYRPLPGSFLQQLVGGAPLGQTTDLAALANGDAPQRRALVELGGARSMIYVALRREGLLMGALAIYRQEVRPFSDKEIALLQNFAAQAVIAMENARLITETREALEQQTATAEVLGVINSSPGDLAPVFDAMLEKALRLCDAVFGNMWMYDGEVGRLAAMRGASQDYRDELLRLGPQKPQPGTSLMRLVEGERLVHIADIAAEDAQRSGVPVRRMLAERAGARTALWVPLRKDGTLLGFIMMYRKEVRPFSDKQIALLENFAAQAVIAMENARLITETREALEQQTATAEVLGVINSSPGDLAPVFDAMLERALRLCGGAYGNLLSYDGEQFRIVAAVHSYRQVGSRPPFRAEPDNLLYSIVAGEPIEYCEDVQRSESYRTKAEFRELVDRGGYRSVLNVALRKDDILLGVIGVFRKEIRPFTDKQIALLQNFAAQAVIAMENARLITETREALEHQTATAEVLGVINASPGDLAPVFDAMLDRALTLCGADFGTLATFDGEFFRAVAHRNVPAELVDAVREPTRLRPGGHFERMFKENAVVHIADLGDTEQYRDGMRWAAALVDGGGARTTLWAALRKEDQLLGALVIYRREVQSFTEKQIALLQNFAAQAVIAMENARLITETREALEQQTATAEVLGVINSSPGDLAPVFDAIVEKATRLCGAAFGGLRTFDGKLFHSVAVYGGSDEEVGQVRELGPIDPATRPPDALWARIARGEPVVHIADMRDLEAYRSSAQARELIDLRQIRTLLAVALAKDDVVLGGLTINRREVRPFSDQEIGLLRNFAEQAVIAIENTRLITETREALEQQTATAEVLGVINASPGDLAPVFDAMLEKAMRLCEAAFGVFWIVGGSGVRAAASQGVPPAYREFLAGEHAPPGPRSGVARTVREGRTLHFADAAAGDAYRSGDPFAVAAVELGGVRTLLNAPLLKDGEVVGILAVFRQEVRPFTDKQIALLQNFAAQAVIAMENARLITETREALEQQTATAEVLGVINSSPGDLAPVFDAMLEKALRLCDAAFGQLMTYDGDRFSPAAVQGEQRAVEWLRRRGPARPGPGTTMERIVRGERLVHIADAAEDDAYRQGEATRRAMVDIAGCRSLLTVALRKDDVLLGAISVYRQSVQRFTEKEIALLQNFAAQAVIAMENARLLGELRQRNDEIAGWNRELEDRVAAQLGELERVGKLKRFLAPQLAELIVARGDEAVLETHRRDIVVVFCDLRDFTAFAETAEPEEVLDLLREYHGALGPVVSASEGTLDHFSGDGIMVFFNDPVPVADASERAVRMAIEMRAAMARLQAQWRRQGRRIGFGAGIARGYATLGQIGFADRIDYTAIGTVCNLAARLCAEAKDGQILLSQRVAAAVEEAMPLEEIGEVALKGLREPGAVYNVPA